MRVPNNPNIDENMYSPFNLLNIQLNSEHRDIDIANLSVCLSVCLSVRLFVCPLSSGILWKRLNVLF